LWKGNKEQLLNQARALGIEDRIRLTDFVPDEHLAPLYGGAKAFVYPTFSEGFGLPAVESMQCGTPLICSDIPVLREVAGDAALYANPHQPEEIASRLVDILNPDTASALSEKGRTRAALYSWESTAQIVVKAYTQSLRELGHI
jgi:glycosyltransferase involved in cell wall biosynthesis